MESKEKPVFVQYIRANHVKLIEQRLRKKYRFFIRAFQKELNKLKRVDVQIVTELIKKKTEAGHREPVIRLLYQWYHLLPSDLHNQPMKNIMNILLHSIIQMHNRSDRIISKQEVVHYINKRTIYKMT